MCNCNCVANLFVLRFRHSGFICRPQDLRNCIQAKNKIRGRCGDKTCLQFNFMRLNHNENCTAGKICKKQIRSFPNFAGSVMKILLICGLLNFRSKSKFLSQFLPASKSVQWYRVKFYDLAIDLYCKSRKSGHTRCIFYLQEIKVIQSIALKEKILWESNEDHWLYVWVQLVHCFQFPKL